MVGRSLLPFGDTFAVLMVVFLVLSLSVGRFTFGPEGTSVREPMLITIGGGDPFGTDAIALVGFSSNVDDVDYRRTIENRSGDVNRVISLLRGSLDDAEIVALHTDSEGNLPYQEFPFPATAISAREFYDSLMNDVRQSNAGFHHKIPNIDGRLLSPVVFPLYTSEIFALTDNCRPYEAVSRNITLSDAVDLVATGFETHEEQPSVSLALDATRTDALTLVGIFIAPPTPTDPDIAIDRLAFSPAVCLGYKGVAKDALFPPTALDPTVPCGRFESFIENRFVRLHAGDQSWAGSPTGNPPFLVSELPRRPYVVVRPNDPEARRRLGELVYHSVIPRPVEIRVFEADGDERLFRTPTWSEMFATGGRASPNDAWTSRGLCQANVDAFANGEADNAAYLFSFRMSIGRDGDIDHYGTLIELPVREEP